MSYKSMIANFDRISRRLPASRWPACPRSARAGVAGVEIYVKYSPCGQHNLSSIFSQREPSRWCLRPHRLRHLQIYNADAWMWTSTVGRWIKQSSARSSPATCKRRTSGPNDDALQRRSGRSSARRLRRSCTTIIQGQSGGRQQMGERWLLTAEMLSSPHRGANISVVPARRLPAQPHRG
jgi:hypothetical protein